MSAALASRAAGRLLRRSLALVVAAAVLAGNPSHEAAAQSGEEAAFVDAINAIREDLGLAALEWHDELADLGREHAARMAEAGSIFHADPISAGFGGEWQKLGENVGVGASVDVLVDAFVASPGHYANIIDPTFTHIGVGVVWDGAALYTTHRFLQPPASTPASDEPVATPTAPTTNPGDSPPMNDAGVTATRVVALLSLVDPAG